MGGSVGGRSLRATGEVVYGNSCQAMGPSAQFEAMQANELLEKMVEKKWNKRVN